MKKQKGVALIAVLLVSVIVIILVGAAFTVTYMEAKQSASNETLTKAYYLAHSAVEVMSADIIKRTKDLEILRARILDATTEEELDAAVEAYQNAADFFDQNIVPKTTGLYVHKISNITGVSDVEVSSLVSGGNLVIKIKAKATVSGESASVSAEMTAVPTTFSKEVTVEGSVFSVPLRALEVIDLTDSDNIVNGGTVIYGDEFIIQHGDSENINPVHSHEPLPDWPLPAGLTVSEMPKDLNVDTTAGDVSLYFDSLKLNGNGTITITGNNDLYIYANKVDLMNGSFSIRATSPDADVYFVILGDGDFTINGDFFSGVRSPFYKPSLYWYAPDCNITITGSADQFSGSVAGQNITMENNARIIYDQPVRSDGSPGTVKTITINYSSFDGGDKSVKWLS